MKSSKAKTRKQDRLNTYAESEIDRSLMLGYIVAVHRGWFPMPALIEPDYRKWFR